MLHIVATGTIEEVPQGFASFLAIGLAVLFIIGLLISVFEKKDK